MAKRNITSKRKELSQNRILDACAKLFREKGFLSTSLRNIAQEANILPGSLYYRFQTKEEMLLALMERSVERASQAILFSIADITDPIERIRVGLQTYLKILLAEDDAIQVLFYDWRTLEGPSRQKMIAYRDRFENLWRGIILNAAGAGLIRPDTDLNLVLFLGFGAANWSAIWYKPNGKYTPEEIADSLWAIMGFGVLKDERREQYLSSLPVSHGRSKIARKAKNVD